MTKIEWYHELIIEPDGEDIGLTREMNLHVRRKLGGV